MRARGRRTTGKRSTVRPLSISIAVCTTLCVLIARPAVADPVNNGTIPDTGALPVPSAPLTVPGDTNPGAATVAPVTGPIASQVMAKQAQQEGVGEKLKKAGE